MEIACPSCARKHNTEDYPNAFDISCACGYSILLPDESALARDKDPAFARPPESLAEEVPAMPDFAAPPVEEAPVFPNEAPPPPSLEESFPLPGMPEEAQMGESPVDLPAVETLTPPEQLPEGMPYDPFEIPASAASGLEDAPAAESSANAAEAASPASPAPTRAKTQILIEKSIRSSLGQTLGYNYRLKITGLSADDLKTLKRKISDFCHVRPWLDEEVKKRHIILDQMTSDEWQDELPEALAVELYLRTLELGGGCEFSLSS